MKDLTKFFNPILTENQDQAQYEVIENEVLKGNDFDGLNISGSLLSLTTFNEVTFKSCVFFGSKIENCNFINCKFIDCSFQFTGISHTKFRATSFENCKWDHSPLKNNELFMCALDAKTSYFCSKEGNYLISCHSNEEVTWEQVLGQDLIAAASPKIADLQSKREEKSLAQTITDFFIEKIAA
jgi:uncharacterized protein YjbI with pentapeptide repeats